MIARHACGPSHRKANTLLIKRLSHCGNTARGTCAANLGYFVFGEVPDTMMVLAAAIIVLSGLCAFYRDRIRPAKWRQAHRAAA